MVNYCCVFGCGRNSKSSKHLYYYSVPKEPRRQQQWLESAGRLDLLDKAPEKRILYRFCSRHFSPSSIKNKHLCADALPTLYLPGSGVKEPTDDTREEQRVHPNITCDNCGTGITGFRYKCVTCPNYDSCSRCEMAESHPQHFMLRIPTPTKFRNIDIMVNKWQECCKESHVDNDEGTSDDEPISKYIKNYDSGIELTEDIKESICKEVTRAMKQTKIEAKKKNKKVTQKRPSETDKQSKMQRIESVDVTALFSNAQEMVFQDVNEVQNGGSGQAMDVKMEVPPSYQSTHNAQDPGLPLIQMKLSDDLSQLIMEVSDQKTMY